MLNICQSECTWLNHDLIVSKYIYEDVNIQYQSCTCHWFQKVKEKKALFSKRLPTLMPEWGGGGIIHTNLTTTDVSLC